jgi:hypothetical protein
MKKNIQEEIRKTMEAFDRIEPATPRPFLHTRIAARFERGSQSQNVFARLAVQKVWLALIFVLLAGNIFTFFSLSSDMSFSGGTIQAAEEFANDYFPETTTTYNMEDFLTEQQ